MAREDNGNQKVLKGKLLITAKLNVITGLHIGGGSDFAPIGSVDSPVIRDPMTHTPIIPGSSLKGKLRTLLAKNRCAGYVLKDIKYDDKVISRLFGAAGKIVLPARLQFFDIFATTESIESLGQMETDTYMGEVKWENAINRLTGVANPRQIERVPAGAAFDFKLVYNIENEAEIEEDMRTLAEALELLSIDYLGGHGSRGYGRIKIHGYKVKAVGKFDCDSSKLEDLLERTVLL